MITFRTWFEVEYPKELDGFDATDYAGREAAIKKRMQDTGEDYYTAGSNKVDFAVRSGEIIKAWKHIVSTLFPGGNFINNVDFAGDGNVMTYRMQMGKRGVDFSLQRDKYGKDFYATVDFGWNEQPSQLSAKDQDKLISGDENAAAQRLQPGTIDFMKMLQNKYVPAMHKYGIKFFFKAADEGEDSRRNALYTKMLKKNDYQPVNVYGKKNTFKPAGQTY